MTEAADWEPVTIVDTRVGDVRNGRVQIEWKLGGGFNREWGQIFTPAGNKKGSIGFVMDSTPPKVTMNQVIEWTIDRADLKGAVSYVSSSVGATNDAYRRLQVQKAAEAAKQKAAAAAAERERAEIQKELDDLG
jgi:hypothetical protein